jgi:hypothetical protein
MTRSIKYVDKVPYNSIKVMLNTEMVAKKPREKIGLVNANRHNNKNGTVYVFTELILSLPINCPDLLIFFWRRSQLVPHKI